MRIGYLYASALMDPASEKDHEVLRSAGAEEIYADWGSRLYQTRLLEDLAEQRISCLLICRLEDLADTVAAVHQLIWQFQQAGVPIHLVTASTTLTPDQFLAWLQELGRLPSKLQSRRVSQGHHQSRLANKPPPGPTPYGYRRDADRYVLERRQAAVVKDFFEHFLLYGSLRESVRHLQKQHGKKISVATGRRWLTNPVYRGDLAYADGTILRNTHNPILSRQEAAQIDRWLRRNQAIPRRSASAPRSLAGLVLCQTCQKALRIIQVTQRHQHTRYLYLRCQHCRYSLPYEDILQAVIHQICRQLPQQTASFNPIPLEQAKARIEAEINSNDLILHELDRWQDQGLLDQRSLQQRRYHLQSHNAILLGKLDQLPPQNLLEIAQTLSIEPFWQDLSESERRYYFREFLQCVWVNAKAEVNLNFFF